MGWTDLSIIIKLNMLRFWNRLMDFNHKKIKSNKEIYNYYFYITNMNSTSINHKIVSSLSVYQNFVSVDFTTGTQQYNKYNCLDHILQSTDQYLRDTSYHT